MLKELIYEYYENERLKKESENKEVRLNMAPSYMTSCKRQLFYKKINMKVSNPIDTHTYIKFGLGNATHEMIQNLIEKLGFMIECEDFKNIEWEGLEWIYRIDGKIRDKKDNVYIAEIKSIYSNGFRMIENKAKEDHEIQLLLYMIFEKIDKGLILYIGRDSGFMVEYNYTLKSLKEKYKNMFSEKLSELKQLIIDIKNNILPDRDFNIVLKNYKGDIKDKFTKDKVNYKSDWQCSYCNFKDLCWKYEIKEIKNHTFYIDGKFI